MDTELAVEVLQLLGTYGHVMDSRDWERLSEVFEDDVVFDASEVGMPVMHGVQGIRDAFEKARHPLAHTMLNPVIEQVVSGEVRTRSKWLNPFPDGGFSAGDFIDVIVDTPRGLRIKHRVAKSRLRPSTPPL